MLAAAFICCAVAYYCQVCITFVTETLASVIWPSTTQVTFSFTTLFHTASQEVVVSGRRTFCTVCHGIQSLLSVLLQLFFFVSLLTAHETDYKGALAVAFLYTACSLAVLPNSTLAIIIFQRHLLGLMIALQSESTNAANRPFGACVGSPASDTRLWYTSKIFLKWAPWIITICVNCLVWTMPTSGDSWMYPYFVNMCATLLLWSLVVATPGMSLVSARGLKGLNRSCQDTERQQLLHRGEDQE